MTVRTIVLAALTAVPMIGTARADETIALTPPLYREQASSHGSPCGRPPS